MKTISLLILSCLLLNFSGLNAATAFVATSTVEQDSVDLPKVFILGEYEKQFDGLMQEHEALLMSKCDNDMDIAFEKWLSMLQEMEAYSEIIDYDLKGIKMWLNIFWDKNGALDHIVYHLKPNSRNIDIQELTAFFSSFMDNYKFPLVTDEKFSHYGSAAFPTFARRVKTKDAESPKSGHVVKDSVKSNN